MKAIILAAGVGKRLRPLTTSTPKPLLNVGKKPLIDHILDPLRELDVGEVVVVGGYLAGKLERHLEDRNGEVTFVVNRDFTKGNLLSLIAALVHLEGDVLVMNSDHIYPPELLRQFTGQRSEEIRIACDSGRVLKEDDMKVLLDHAGRLRKIGKDLKEYNAGYMGLTFVPASKIWIYKEAVLETHRERGDDADVEEILQHLAVSSSPPQAVDLGGFLWFEVDTVEELREVELRVAGGEW